jgi:hypothetical protein
LTRIKVFSSLSHTRYFILKGLFSINFNKVISKSLILEPEALVQMNTRLIAIIWWAGKAVSKLANSFIPAGKKLLVRRKVGNLTVSRHYMKKHA